MATTEIIERRTVAQETGDTTWYIGRTADGQWAAYDDAEGFVGDDEAPDNAALFATEEEAVRYQRDGWDAAKCPGTWYG
jgi:hypothetical protein